MSKDKGGIGSLLNNPITKMLTDIALVATGNPEFIPLANAGESTAGNLAKGKGIGKSLGMGAVSGLESLAGQEAAGAIGIGGGNSAFNNALGIDISPAATGLPDVGGGFSDFLSKAGSALGISGGTGAGATSGAGSNFDTAAGGGASPFSTSSARGAVSAGSGIGGASGGIGSGVSREIAEALGTPSLDSSGIDQLVKQAGTGGASVLSDAAGKAATDGAGSTGVMSFLKNNANLLLPGAGLAAAAVKGDQMPKGMDQLLQQAGQTSQIGGQLANTLNSGKLPEGAESMVQQAINDGEASIRSKYAQMGMSGSTMEKQEIQALHERAQGQRFSMANDLTNTGLTALNSSSAIYKAIMEGQLTQDQGLSDAIAGLAEASSFGDGLKKAA